MGDGNSSLPAVKSTRVETLRAILRAKGHSWEAAHMMLRSLRESSRQVYESHWARFVAFCRLKGWHMFWVRSHHFSTYMMHLFKEELLPAMIISHRTSVASVLRHWVYDPAADPHIKLLIRAFRLERPVQRRIMPKWDLHLVLSSLLKLPFASECDIQGEFFDDVMADHENCVPASIGFGETALISARIECRGRQVCVLERSHPATTCGISFAGTWFPCEESTTVTGSGMDLRSVNGCLFIGIQHQRYHEKSHQPMDRGDCQGSLHTSWSRVWPSYGTWGQSTVSVMGVQLSGGPTWHPVSGVLEVIWVFQNSYLRDMACIADGMSTLGPVVVAQQVVDPGHLHPPP